MKRNYYEFFLNEIIYKTKRRRDKKKNILKINIKYLISLTQQSTKRFEKRFRVIGKKSCIEERRYQKTRRRYDQRVLFDDAKSGIEYYKFPNVS